jgi:hypothetical protein
MAWWPLRKEWSGAYLLYRGSYLQVTDRFIMRFVIGALHFNVMGSMVI